MPEKILWATGSSEEPIRMTSKQPVQTNSQAGVIPASPAIKDSPAVERALNRSKLYLLVSWSQLYPEDDEFHDYVQCGEFVEDGRAALDALDKALDGIGGERAKLKLVLLRKQFDQIEKVVASECVNWQLSDLQAEHRRVFSNVITLDCPPYETLFGNDHVFAQSQVMGDIAGFYRAFGVELSKDIHERLDHLSVEFEFMHFEAAFLGVVPQPYSETDYRPATFSSPEGQTYECGAQDQGNELSLLLNEVGAESFLDKKDQGKDKESDGPVGTA